MAVRRIVAGLAMLVLLAVFYTNRFSSAGVNPGEDLVEHDLPLAQWYVGSIQQGSFPLWNFHKAYGIPACETPLMGPYYPAFPAYFLLPLGWAVNLGFLVHIGLSALFCWLLCKELGYRDTMAWFCASSWAVCSIFQQYSESGWLSETVAVCYLPGAVWLLVRAEDKAPRNRLLLHLAAGLTLALAVTGGHPANAVIIWASVGFFCIPLACSPRTAGRLAVVFAYALLLSIVVWGPLVWQYWSTPFYRYPQHGHSLFAPLNFLVGEMNRSGFVGRPLLLLGLIGFFLGRERFAASFRALFLASLGMVVCAEFPQVFERIPVVGGIRNAWQWQTGLILSLIVFAGSVLSRLEQFVAGRIRPKTVPILVVAAVLSLQLLDLYQFHARFYPRGFASSIDDYFAQGPIAQAIAEDRSLFRVANIPFNSPVFRANQGTFRGIDCVDARIRGVNLYAMTGNASLTIHYHTADESGLPADICSLLNIKYVIEEVTDPGQLEQYQQGRFEVVRSVELLDGQIPQSFVLLRNQRCFPRAFLIDGAARSEIAAILPAAAEMAPFVSPAPATPAEIWQTLSRYEAVEIERNIDVYRIDYVAERDGLVFLSEMYDPGWKASIDGVPAGLYRALDNFLGVQVPAGAHRVVLAYRPRQIYLFWTISLLTLAVSAATMVIVRRRRVVSVPTETPLVTKEALR